MLLQTWSEGHKNDRDQDQDRDQMSDHQKMRYSYCCNEEEEEEREPEPKFRGGKPILKNGAYAMDAAAATAANAAI